jgi:predicted RNA binding protein YcfA (HicA-like mRNA interferase family)
MSGLLPLKRREFIRRLSALGFAGPYRGTRHDFMVFRQRRQTVPSNSEYSVPQVKMLLRQVEAILGRKIQTDEWSTL